VSVGMSEHDMMRPPLYGHHEESDNVAPIRHLSVIFCQREKIH